MSATYPQNIPFGLWSSPITPAMLSQRIRFEDVQWDGDGQTLLWLEGRSDRGVLVTRPAGEARRDISGDLSVRAGVGYGGGDFTIQNGKLFFVERNGRIYRRSLGYDQPTPLTPAFGACAAPALSPDGNWLVYVYSDGNTDLLGLVDAQGRNWPLQLVCGADFYMQPCWSPDGKRLAWVEWNHPNMPWDGTNLMLATLDGTPPRVSETHAIAGNVDTAVQGPQFSPDGRWLAYLTDEDEWDALVLYNLENGQKHTLVKADGAQLGGPTWVQGTRFFGWRYDSQAIYYLKNDQGFASLWLVELESGQSRQIPTAPYTWLSQIFTSPCNDQVAFIASAPNQPDRILRWDGQRLHIEARSESEDIAPDYLPNPRSIRWNAPDGSPVFGLYSPPSNPRHTAAGLPPAILHIHGGPTSQITARYSADRAYFTSRGYAWLDVNYRGSTGYGRTYRNVLRQQWGAVDVEDAFGGAQALIEQKLANPKQLIIEGGSAGGYTVLNALVHHPGCFKAGICLYGVSNLFTLAMDTHKFEAHYNDSLVGVLPQAAALYQAWSPVFHASLIRDALAVFQGSIDRVVPPSQSEEIVAHLRQNGVAHIYRLYEGEGHGFRKSETILDYLQQVERFLIQNVIFTA